MALIIISFSFPVLSQKITPPENNGAEDSTLKWKIKGGVRGSYACGISDPSYTIKPYLEGGFAGKWLELLAGFTWYQHYQVGDGAGNYGYINIAQPGIRLSYNPAEFLELSGGYRYLKGGMDYNAHDYSAGIDFDFDAFSIGGSYGGKIEEYFYNSINMKSLSNSFSLNACYYITDSVSIDGGLEYFMSYYDTFDSTYTKAGGQLGITARPWDPISLTGDVGYARDSADYSLYSVNALVRVKFLANYSLSAMYMLTFYQAPPDDSSITSSGHGSGKSGAGGGNNPMLDPSLRGTSFFTHNVSLGVQFSY